MTPTRIAVAVLALGILGLVFSGVRAPATNAIAERWTPGVHNELPGAELYQLSCAKCHGKSLDGKEGPALGRGSDAVDHTDEEIADAVMMGEDEMPALRGALTVDQVASIIRYLREVQSAGPGE